MGDGIAEGTLLFCISSQPIIGSWYVCVLAGSTQCRLLHGWVNEEGGSMWCMGGGSAPSKHQSLNVFKTHGGYHPVAGPVTQNSRDMLLLTTAGGEQGTGVLGPGPRSLNMWRTMRLCQCRRGGLQESTRSRPEDQLLPIRL